MIFIIAVLVTIVAFFVWRSAAAKSKEHTIGTQSISNISMLIMSVFSILAISQCFTQVPAGHVGVVDFFGIVSERTLRSGISVVNPMANVIKFSIQTKEHKETMEVLSREGLTIGLEISALYRLNPDSAARVYKTVAGGDYETIILIPQFRSISRAVTASFQPAHFIPLKGINWVWQFRMN